MKRTFLLAAVAAALFSGSASAQKNLLLDQEFWKSKPDVAAVKDAIAKGSDPAAFNPNAFDPTVLAINSDAPFATIEYLLNQDGNKVDKLTHDSRIYLHWAAYRGNLALVNYLLTKGSNVNHTDSHGSTPVEFAAGAGQTDAALYDAFAKAGVDLKRKDENGANLLLKAVAGDKDFVLTNYLVSKGLPLSTTDKNGATAFDYAARGGNVTLLKALYQKGVKPTKNALIMAAQGSRRGAASLEVYQYLVDDLKIAASSTSANGETVLHYLVRKPNQTEIIQYFLTKGVDVNKPDTDGNTVLMNAAAGRTTNIVSLLLPKIKDIDAINNKGESALTAAIKSGSTDIVTALVQKGADIQITDKDGNNLAYHLVQSYRPMPEMAGGGRPGGPGGEGPRQDIFGDKVKFLTSNGLNVAAAQKDGSTLYHLAVTKNNLDLLKKLSTLNIDVNAKNKEGLTVLHKAAMISNDDILLKYLLSIGAQKDAKTDFDETAFALAKENEILTKNNVSLDFLK